MKWVISVVAFILCVAAPVIGATSSPPAPTTQEMQGLLDSGQYNDVLRDVAHALALGGREGQAYEKYDLLILRGETQLRLKQSAPAALAFKQATGQTVDMQKAAVASAMDLLIRRSPQFQYTPRKVATGVKPAPIPITDPQNRKLALAALYDDELAAAGEALAEGKKAVSLPQIAAAVKAIQSHSLVALDRTVHGNVDDIQRATGDLKARTKDLITKALDQMSKQTKEIADHADQMNRIPSMRAGQPDTMQRRGLQGSDRQNLQGIVQGCKQIAGAARELMGALSDTPADADTLVQQANDVLQKAEQAIKAG